MEFPSPEYDKLLKKRLYAKAIVTRYTTEAEIVAYYQTRQDAGEIKSGKQALVQDILALRGITPATTDKKEYQRQYKNLHKRFESRLEKPHKVSPKNAKEYAALGKKIGVTRTPPPEGFKIWWNADLHISNDCGFIRGYTTTFTGQAAQDLLDDPRIYLVVDAYFTNDGSGRGLTVVDDLSDLDPDSPVNGVCKMNWLKVNAKRGKK